MPSTFDNQPVQLSGFKDCIRLTGAPSLRQQVASKSSEILLGNGITWLGPVLLCPLSCILLDSQEEVVGGAGSYLWLSIHYFTHDLISPTQVPQKHISIAHCLFSAHGLYTQYTMLLTSLGGGEIC